VGGGARGKWEKRGHWGTKSVVMQGKNNAPFFNQFGGGEGKRTGKRKKEKKWVDLARREELGWQGDV